MVANVKPDGSLTVDWWNNVTWVTDQALTLVNFPVSESRHFSAVLGHADKRVYTLSNDSILEWQFSSYDAAVLDTCGQGHHNNFKLSWDKTESHS
jgi:hypothetical protein